MLSAVSPREPGVIAVVDARVDAAIARNGRAELVIVLMAVSLFTVGLLALLVGYWLRNPYVVGGSVLLQGFLVFPIAEVRKLRRDNIILQTFPQFINVLPEDKAALEIQNMLRHLLGSRE